MTGSPPKRTPRARRPKAEPAEILVTPPHQDITLITGTDTGVGKTWITCALARALVDAGQRVVAIKPIETGCAEPPSPDEDGVRLAAATGQTDPRHALIRLRKPVAAALAAEEEGVTIDVPALVDRIKGYSASCDQTLVEGTGGLLAPLTWQDNALDLAHGLDARVLIIGRDRLGTINHTLLTLRVLQSVNVRILGVVLTTPPETDPSTGSNAEAIARLTGLDLVWTVPQLSDRAQAAEAVKEVAGWLLP
jgi:dethiobiotin synthetase